MAWIRLSDDYNDHPKFARLSDGAFRLWHQGMGFCRKFQTDGVIPVATMRTWPAYSLKRRRELTTPWQAGESALWHDGPESVLVHDYLAWNLSKAEERSDRTEATTRMRRLRSKGKQPRDASPTANIPSRDGDVPGMGTVQDLRSSEGEFEGKPSPDTTRDAAAAWFCARFTELYTLHRHGAHYHVKPSLDWTRICDLLTTWNIARLEKLAVILLTTDDEWIAKTDRGIGVFVARASWCDDRLKAWELEHGLTVD